MANIDVEVKQGFYETLKHYTYKSPQVFGEFIDNSIQSYEDNKNILTMESGYKLKVEINVEWAMGSDNVVRAKKITVRDNAAGMTSAQFAQAFKSADRTITRNGMNEFGLGMKAAACWLGAKWSVISKSIAEDITHRLDFDVEKVSKEEIREIQSLDTIEPDRKHGTEIIITDFWSHNQIRQDEQDYITKSIASIYRYFLRKGELEIWFGEQLLTFEDYEVLVAPPHNNPEGENIEWKCAVSQSYKQYSVSGFVALLKDTNDDKRGVVIMRNHRVVMGFDPKERTIGKKFIGQVGSNKYRRVFGELEITGFDVAFGKNKVNDEAMLEALLDMAAGKLIKGGINLLAQGDKYRKRKNAGPKPSPSPTPTPTPSPAPTPTPSPSPAPEPPVVSGGGASVPTPTPATPQPASPFPKEGKFKFGGIDYKIKMEEGTESTELFWNDLSQKSENILLCKVNMHHPFFEAYGKPTKALMALIKALSIAKFKATIDSSSASAMMNDFNQIISSQEVQD